MTAPDLDGPTLLLIEPDSLFRSTVASVARQLQLAQVRESTSVEASERLLDGQRFEALVVAWDAEGHALRLVRDLRGSRFRSACNIPVVVMAAQCDGDMVAQMKELEVRRIVLKPFKVKTILEAISGLFATPEVAEAVHS